MPFRLIVAAFASLSLAAPALALSCIPPDPKRAFAEADAAPEAYYVILGSFSGGPGPREGGTLEGTPRKYAATFKGHLVNRNGKAEPLERHVWVDEQCAGPWCAELPVGQPVLTFLRLDPDGPGVVEIGPCYGRLFANPTAQQLQAVQSCFEGGCTAP